MKPPVFVGISGGSGSGKTFLAKKLLDTIGADKAVMIFQDNYYKPKSQVPKDENGVENFDVPEAIDLDAFLSDLRTLQRGQAIQRQEYTYNHPSKKPATITIAPAPVVIVEGIFLYSIAEIREMLTLRLFVDAGDVVKIKRRIERDARERGYDLDDVLYRYQHHVLPAYKVYLEPYIYLADIVIPNETDSTRATEVVAAFLTSKINQGN